MNFAVLGGGHGAQRRQPPSRKLGGERITCTRAFRRALFSESRYLLAHRDAVPRWIRAAGLAVNDDIVCHAGTLSRGPTRPSPRAWQPTWHPGSPKPLRWCNEAPPAIVAG